ncbi:MAG: polysaccharide biosynthesis protein, partial [Proteobacteria bacterium]|nr:polysaccharide biosynthesis protein [Pseudomonadota bacterium]
RQMIRLAGFVPEKDIGIVFTGIRPGEKLFEEVLHDDEAPLETSFDGFFLARPRIVALDKLQPSLTRIFDRAASGDDAAVRALLQEIIDEYAPTHADSGRIAAI